MSKNVIKRADLVLIITGKDKGKTGKVLNVDPKMARAIVEGVNIYKKNVKPSKKYPQGGIIDINAPIKFSNLMVVCPSCKKATRIKSKNAGKEKRRACIRCSEVLS